MNLIKSVFEMSEKLLFTEPMNVFINEASLEKLAKEMKEEGETPFDMPKVNDPTKSVLIELIASSINYCYWYGNANVRPNEVHSGAMYNIVERTFEDYKPQFFEFPARIHNLIDELSVNRFPLIEERARHLIELIDRDAPAFAQEVVEKKDNFLYLFESLVRRFRGFSSDMFLKRASLFFIQLYRKYGWFRNDMKILHVPADYQVPKILKHYNAVYYKSELDEKIKNGELIPKHSLEETQIRAATIQACMLLQELTDWNIANIDGWLWLRRKTATEPFHLTITTDY